MQGLTALTLLLAPLLSACPVTPEPCLWVVTNSIGTAAAPTALRGLFLREALGPWGENLFGESDLLPFGESYSFLLPPGSPVLDLRGADGDGSTWSSYGAHECADGGRLETELTSENLDIPCTWTITNRIGDSSLNYAMLDLWIRVAGNSDWGSGFLGGEPLGYDGAVEVQVETGWTYDLSVMDQDGVFYLINGDQTCLDGEALSTVVTLADEAPPCLWQVTNSIDGDLGPLRIVALAVTPSGTGQTTVYELTNSLSFGDATEVPFFARAVWDLQAIDEIGQTYSYPESALCLDGGEVYALQVVGSDADP